MEKTKIDWCDSTWNPVTGCFHDCEYCYARGIAKRFGKKHPDISAFGLQEPPIHVLDNPIDGTSYPFMFEPTFHAYRLSDYINKKNTMIFSLGIVIIIGLEPLSLVKLI